MLYRTLLLVLIFASVSCSDDEIFTVNFKLNYDTEFTIQGGTIIDVPLNIFTPDIKTNSQTEFENNQTHADKVSEVKLNFLNLAITDPPNKTFSFLKNIYIYLNADGLDEIRIAYKENIENSAQLLELIVTDANLAEYVKKDSYSLRVETTTDELLSQDVKVRADIQFQVKAELL